jgi:hypothetical protein
LPCEARRDGQARVQIRAMPSYHRNRGCTRRRAHYRSRQSVRRVLTRVSAVLASSWHVDHDVLGGG